MTNVTLASSGSVSNAVVGSYAISASGANGVGLTNYTIGYSNGTLTVGAASLLITAGNTNKVYGATLNPTDYTAAGLLNGDSVTNVALASSGSVSNAAVGSYAISASGASGVGLTNYSIGYSNGTLTVGTASLTITALDAGKAAGATLTFAGTEFTSAGLLNGDVVTGATLASAGAAGGAAVGTYPITVTNAAGSGLPNYIVSYVAGTLTVTNAGSEFKITGITVSDGVATVTWNSVPSQSYRLLYKDDLLAANWSVVPRDVTAVGTSTSHTNLIGGAMQRFYRVQRIANSAPTLATLEDVSMPELTTLTVTNTAQDADLPGDLLTYSLVGAPTNATISSAGVITWTPTETQGPSTNVLTTVVTDNAGVSATNSFVVLVTEVNEAPGFIATPANVTISAQTPLTVTNAATDADLPAQVLIYNLVGAPVGAVVTNGVITWTPTMGQAPSTNEIVTVVSDGLVSTTNSFTVFVTVPVNVVPFEITSIRITNDIATITWNSVSNQSYVLQYKDDLTNPNWIEVPVSIQATGLSTSTTNVLGGVPQRFYRVRLGTSAVVVPAPQITSITLSSGLVTVTWTSVAGHFYRLQYNADLTTTNWVDLLPEVTAAGPTSSATDLLTGGVDQRFYRVWLRQ